MCCGGQTGPFGAAPLACTLSTSPTASMQLPSCRRVRGAWSCRCGDLVGRVRRAKYLRPPVPVRKAPARRPSSWAARLCRSSSWRWCWTRRARCPWLFPSTARLHSLVPTPRCGCQSQSATGGMTLKSTPGQADRTTTTGGEQVEAVTAVQAAATGVVPLASAPMCPAWAQVAVGRVVPMPRVLPVPVRGRERAEARTPRPTLHRLRRCSRLCGRCEFG